MNEPNKHIAEMGRILQQAGIGSPLPAPERAIQEELKETAMQEAAQELAIESLPVETGLQPDA